MLNTTARQNTTPRTVLVVEDEPTLATAIAQRKDGPLAWPGTALPPSRPRPSYAPIW